MVLLGAGILGAGVCGRGAAVCVPPERNAARLEPALPAGRPCVCCRACLLGRVQVKPVLILIMTCFCWVFVLLLVAFLLICIQQMGFAGACRFPGSFVLTVLRGQLVLLQGIWFIQIAEILFKGKAPFLTTLTCTLDPLFDIQEPGARPC